MQKIKRKLYNRIIESELTRLELRFLFYLAARCNVAGGIEGVYYADISEELDCSIAKFYHLRDSLKEKGFISWEKNHSADMDIVLLGNSFMTGLDNEVSYEDYVDINISVFQDPDFFKLKAKAIQVAMEFIGRVAANEAINAANNPTWYKYNKYDDEKRRKLWYLPYNEYKKLSLKLNVSSRMIKKYIESLKKWINIHTVETEGKSYDVVTVLKSSLLHKEYKSSKKSRKIYAERFQNIHFLKTYCRRNKIKSDPEHLSDTADLIKQYEGIAKTKGKNILNVICIAIQRTVSNVLNSYSVHNALKKYVNM